MRDLFEYPEKPTTYQQYVAFEREAQTYCLQSVRLPSSAAFFRDTFSVMSATEFHDFMRGLPAWRRDALLRAYALGFDAWMDEQVQRDDQADGDVDIGEIHERVQDLLRTIAHPYPD